jgi:glyoxylase-like metal-dependent hydrolase (beta-lactamase superfamily II)
MQREEYGHYVADALRTGKHVEGAEPDDVSALARINKSGRMTLVNGDNQEIFPGITCYIGGKHTWQSQYLGVQTRRGIVVLASDNVYLFENLEKHLPITATLDAKSNLAAQDRMKTLAASPDLIIPGHDPKVFSLFPKVAPHVVRIE